MKCTIARSAWKLLALGVLIAFTQPGTVSVKCFDGGDEVEVGDEEWSFLKISAIKLGNLVVNP